MLCRVEEMEQADPATRIARGLYMGSMSAASEPEKYNLIVSAAEEWTPLKARGVSRMHIKLNDILWDFYNNQEELKNVVDAAKIIATEISAGKTALIFCNMGMNRSGLVTALTLMHLGYSPSAAIKAIRKRHPCTLSNESFVEALKFARSEQMA